MLVGITGNMGSGKSLFMRFLGRYGHRTHDSDRIVDEIYREARVVSALEAAFGPEVAPNGRVDRRALAAKVFASSLNTRRLNSIVHPLVRERIAAIPHYDGIVFVEVPLLFESRMQDLFDKVILLRAPHEVCAARSVSRGFAEDDFERRAASQYSADRVAAMADLVVDSDCSANELAAKAEKAIGALKR